MRPSSCLSRFLQALLVVALLGIPQLAHGQLQGLLLLQMKGWITLTPGYIASQGVSVTYATTASLCFNSGGVPASDTTTALNNQMRYYVAESGVGADLSFYIGSSAEPTAANPNACVDRVSSTTVSPNSANCAYRWRYGFYDLYSYQGEPGTAYWKGLYWTTGQSQVLNQYEQYLWNDTAAPNSFPRGYYYTINGYGTWAMLRMDVPAAPTDNDPNPLAKYMAVCEVQLYPQHPATTTRMPQPAFVNGFKTLTWPQEHWWVIFLIIAVILLVVLIGIIIYCCISSAKPKEEPPVHAMVLRERIGNAYIVSDAAHDSSNGSGARNSADAQNQNATYLQQQQAATEMQRRLGRGFNTQEQPQDPEDMLMGAAGIFGRVDRKQYGDGNVIGNGGDQKGDGYYAKVSTGDLREDELVSLSEQAQKSGDTSTGVGVSALKRLNSRKVRGRKIVQTVDDVNVPQAGEIDEANVAL